MRPTNTREKKTSHRIAYTQLHRFTRVYNNLWFRFWHASRNDLYFYKLFRSASVSLKAEVQKKKTGSSDRCVWCPPTPVKQIILRGCLYMEMMWGGNDFINVQHSVAGVGCCCCNCNINNKNKLQNLLAGSAISSFFPFVSARITRNLH